MGRRAKIESNEVLHRAMHLFWERGSEAVTTRDLEAMLDVRAPAIYRRFASKEALFVASVNHYVDTVIAGRIDTLLGASADPMVALKMFFTSTLQPHGRQSRLRGCLLANTATHADGQIPEIRLALVRGWGLIDEAFRREIKRAQDTGQFRADLDPGAVSQAMLMSLQGLLTLVRAGITDLQPGIDATFRMFGARSADETRTGPRSD